jgi:DNA-directed RNA polymerase subunit RPC12/RpoP
MVRKEFKCGRCGRCFEVEALDEREKQDPRIPKGPIRCPGCGSMMVQELRTVRRAS